MNKISQIINEIFDSCQNIGQISIQIILVGSKCSIYVVKNPISLIFGSPQTLHITTIFEEILQIIGKICDTLRIPNISRDRKYTSAHFT